MAGEFLLDQPIRFVHTADCHLDAPIADLGGAAQAGMRRRELEEAFGRIIEDARKERVDIVLIAGDFLEHSTVRKQTVEWAKELLAGVECPVFIAPGNHDPVTGRSYYNTLWPENVHIFRHQRPSHVAVEPLDLVVHGLGWEQSHYREPLLKSYRVPEDGRRHIIIIHGDTLDIENTEYLPLDPSELRATGADYVALGHVHTYRFYETDGRLYAAYPGSPEPMRFKELGEHGYIRGTLGADVRLQFVPIAQRQFHKPEVDVTECLHEQAIAERVLEVTRDQRRHQDLFRVTLTGVLNPEFELELDSLHERLAGDFYYLELENGTTKDYDLEALAEGPSSSLETMFVSRLLSELETAEGDDEEELYRQALEYGLDALIHGKVVVP